MATKTTFIYGLCDPRDGQLRYVGKTVLVPKRRLSTHIWGARVSPKKRHLFAWITALATIGIAPSIFTIEEVPPGGDWEEAECFWIAYFRFIGADLCNLTIGGEGAPGAKLSEAHKHRLRQFCGPKSHLFGKPMRPETRRALDAALAVCRSNPEWCDWAESRRSAGRTPEKMVNSIAGLLAIRLDPVRYAERERKRIAKTKTPEARYRVGLQSADLWRTRRDQIIAAQNAGKGEEFKLKQSISRKKLWTDPASSYWQVFLTPGEREEIRTALKSGMTGAAAAKKFGLSQSRISQIKHGA